MDKKDVTPITHLAHPARLVAAMEDAQGLREMLLSEESRVVQTFQDDTIVLAEISRRLQQPGFAPRLSHLIDSSARGAGGTEMGNAMGLLAFLRHLVKPAPHFLIDDELVHMLEQTDIAADVPMGIFKLPYPRLYLELGRGRDISATIPNMLTGDHIIEGAYIERGAHQEGEFVYIVVTGSPIGKPGGPLDDAIMSIALPLEDPERSIPDTIAYARRRAHEESLKRGLRAAPSMWDAKAIDAVLLLVKALLYIELPETRRSFHSERTEAMKAAAGMKNPAKREKAQRRAGRLSDYILIQAQSAHRPAAHAEQGRGVRQHWRRGHYRMQAHGPQMTLRKLVFIQPMLVAGHIDDQADTPSYRVV